MLAETSIEFIIIFLVFCFKTEWWISVLAFSPPVFRFYTKSDRESFNSFQNVFRNKEREQNNYISCVFKYNFAFCPQFPKPHS